jgi:hypothetical protein
MNAIATITAHQSYTWVLREVFLAAVKRLPYFGGGGFTYRRNPHPGPIQIDDIPLVGVYIGDEVMTPDGDGNAGAIRFLHQAKFSFSVLVLNNDPALAEQQLDGAFWAIMNGLWRDEYITNFLDTWNPQLGADNPDNTRFEAITRGVRRHRFGNAGHNNDTPFAELQYEITMTYRTEFGARVPDDFLHMHVETVPLADDGTVPGPDEVERIISEYFFEPTDATKQAPPAPRFKGERS